MLICQFEQNKNLEATFPGLVYTKEKHNYNTRSARKKPVRYLSLVGHMHANTNALKDWNRFKKQKSTENLTYPVVKNIFKKIVPASYQHFFPDFGSFSLLYMTIEQTEKEVIIVGIGGHTPPPLF